ncbi:cyclic pyranopterin monophosphate synthase MoaC [Salinispira pacifica]
MLTHVSEGNLPNMVDVGGKEVTARSAVAEAWVQLPEELASKFDGGELHTKKGPVFQTAIIAGTMGAKRTSELIPFCHPLALEDCKLSVTMEAQGRVHILCSVSVHHKTGVEMEAMTGASVAALTVYDMCKSASRGIVIERVHLLSKRGGKSDYDRSPQDRSQPDG